MKKWESSVRKLGLFHFILLPQWFYYMSYPQKNDKKWIIHHDYLLKPAFKNYICKSYITITLINTVC